MREWLRGQLGVPQAPIGLFADFLWALPQERRFCVPCLARLYGISEDAVQQQLQALAGHIEASRAWRCWTCEQTAPTYRVRRSQSAAA